MIYYVDFFCYFLSEILSCIIATLKFECIYVTKPSRTQPLNLVPRLCLKPEFEVQDHQAFTNFVSHGFTVIQLVQDRNNSDR